MGRMLHAAQNASNLPDARQILKVLNLLSCEGTGRKTDPYRYWLPTREAAWQHDIAYLLHEQQIKDLQLLSKPRRDKGEEKAR